VEHSQMLPAALMACIALLAVALSATDSAERAGRKEPDVAPSAPSTDWRRLGPPRPGEWLYVFDEPGQTFAEYRALFRGRAPERGTFAIGIVPLGSVMQEHGALVRALARYAAIFFDTQVELLPAEPLPASCYNPRRRQFRADALLERVRWPLPHEPDEVLAAIGLTSVDLYQGNLNFVFGVADHRKHVSLCSVHRFLPRRDEPQRLALVRTLKTGTHEIGHMLGMAHCTFYHCLMNGSNSLAESDRRPLFLCPVCLRKLEWRLGFDRRKRYERLKAFFDECGLMEQAAFCERRLAELPPKAQSDGAETGEAEQQ